MKVSAESVLPATPDVVWRRLVSWEGQARWMRDVDSIRVLSTNREGVGVRLAARTRVLLIPLFTDRIEVTIWDEPRRLTIAHLGLVRGSGEWLLSTEGPHTRLRWTEDVSLGPRLVGEAALLVYRPVLRRLMRGALRRLRSAIEEGAS